MLFRLFLIFTLIPLIELSILVWLSQQTSLLTTIALVIVTGIIGAYLVRLEGLRVLRRIPAELASGRPPLDALPDGLMIAISGALMITPGLLTDVVGFLLLLPQFRSVLKLWLAAYLQKHATVIVKRQFEQTFDKTPTTRQEVTDDVIDVEFTRRSAEEMDSIKKPS